MMEIRLHIGNLKFKTTQTLRALSKTHRARDKIYLSKSIYSVIYECLYINVCVYINEMS